MKRTILVAAAAVLGIGLLTLPAQADDDDRDRRHRYSNHRYSNHRSSNHGNVWNSIARQVYRDFVAPRGDYTPYPYAQPGYIQPGYGQSFYQPNYGPIYPSPTFSGGTTQLHVTVPDPFAQVFFDGQPTSGTGFQRVFTTPPLQPGENYSYRITVVWNYNGRPVSEERMQAVAAGQSLTVDFTTPNIPNLPAPTPLR